jgi:uncharacterized protein
VPEFDSFPVGMPAWVDLWSRDVGASRDFYCALFDWQIEELAPAANGYMKFTKGAKKVGGLGPLRFDDQPPTWTTYVNVEDVGVIARAVTQYGGAVVVEPNDVLDSGRMALFRDPVGALFGAWQPNRSNGVELAYEPSSFCWNELQTRDLERARSFYAGVFGWIPDTSELGGMSYTEWKVGTSSAGGMMRLPDSVSSAFSAFWIVYFAVEDADISTERANELGGTTLSAPTDIPAGRFAVLADPTEVAFGVIKLENVAQLSVQG